MLYFGALCIQDVFIHREIEIVSVIHISLAFEIRPFRLSETTKICGGQSIVTLRLSARTTTFVKDIFTLHFYLNILKTFISQVTVRVENFDYIGEHLLVI